MFRPDVAAASLAYLNLTFTLMYVAAIAAFDFEIFCCLLQDSENSLKKCQHLKGPLPVVVKSSYTTDGFYMMRGINPRVR